MMLADEVTQEIAAQLDDPDLGVSVILRHIEPGAYNIATGQTSAPTTTENTTKALIFSGTTKAIDGALVQLSDRKCILKVLGMTMEPKVGDLIIVGSRTYSIITVKATELGGQIILYKLELKG